MIGAILPLLGQILGTTLAPPAAPSGTARPAVPPEICVAIRTDWRGSIADTRSIAVDPVPETYRNQYGWSGCQPLDKAALIDWHLAFGDEASTTKALQFLTETALAGMPTPERFEDTLAVTWPAAQRSSNAHAADRLIETQQRFLFLARQYLRAAEFFRSPTALATGARYFSAARRGLDVFYGGARIALIDQASPMRYGGALFTGDIISVRDLEMRYAIARARMSGSAAEWAQAGAVVEANLDPAARDIAMIAFDRNDDYCSDPAASARLKEACARENNLSRRLRAAWFNAELVAQFTDGKVVPAPLPPSSDGFDVAMAVISITAVPTDSDIVRYDETADDQVQLRLARAERLFRKSRALPPDAEETGALRAAALIDLDNAERLVPVALNPNRFRQIASLYLLIYDTMPSTGRTADVQRQATYFRTMLARLGDVADGR